MALIAGSAIVVAAGLLVGTGILPTPAYPPSGAQWVWEVEACGTQEMIPAMAQHVYPMWATVHFHWVVQPGGWYATYDVLGLDNGFDYGAAGTNGSGSFVSDASPVEFWLPIVIPSNLSSECSTVVVTTTVTYSV
jgi:hypothetical protein